MSGLECEHRFCKLCWREYLKTKIMDEGMGLVCSIILLLISFKFFNVIMFQLQLLFN
jgi:hypothetical protein